MASALILACSLCACAQTTAEKPLPPIRVILHFKETLAFNNAAFLQALHDQTQAQVQYVTAVSKDTHVYRFQPPTGLSYTQLIQRLSNMPGIAHVEADQKILLP